MSPVSHITDIKCDLQEWVRFVYRRKQGHVDIKSGIRSRVIHNTEPIFLGGLIDNQIDFYFEAGPNDNLLSNCMRDERENTAEDYDGRNPNVLPEEDLIPRWDISIDELQLIFDRSRMERVYN